MFSRYSDLSNVISKQHRRHIVCMIPMHLLWTSKSSLFQLFCFLHCLLTGWRFVRRQQHIWLLHWAGHYSDYLFPALFAYQILICFMSVAYLSPVLSPLHLRCVGYFEQVIVSVSLFPALLTIWTLICSMSAVLVH